MGKLQRLVTQGFGGTRTNCLTLSHGFMTLRNLKSASAVVFALLMTNTEEEALTFLSLSRISDLQQVRFVLVVMHSSFEEQLANC